MKKNYTLLMAIIFVLTFRSAFAQSPYCTPTYSAGCGSGDGLTLFQLGTINQTIACDGVPNTWYHDYTASSTQLQAGITYTLTMQAGYPGTYVSVWVDLNNDLIFDPTEIFVYNLVCAAAATNYTAPITLPLGTPDGNYRIRYRTSWSSSVSDPCATYTYGNSADFTITSNTYCIPTYSYGCLVGDGLILFQLGTINQTIACDGFPDSWYHNYTATFNQLQVGVPYTLTVQAGYTGSNVTVWIDYNNNLIFEPSEMVVTDLYCANSYTNYTATITVPAGTPDGKHRMRYRTNWVSSASDPCATFTYGNSADFTVSTYAEYCTPYYTVGCTAGDGLTLFQLGTINQAIACDGVPDAWYHDYTGISTQLQDEVPYTLTVQAGYYNTYVCVWIDFNNNLTFEPSEMVVSNLNCVSISTNYTATITVPASSLNGNHRMRYRTSWSSTAGDPCATFTYGNSADFTVTTSNLPANAGVITGITSVCAGTTAIAYSVDPIPYATGYNWSVPSGATIASGANTNAITVNYSSVALSGNIVVAGTNSYGAGVSSTLGISVFPTPTPTISGANNLCEFSNYYTYTTEPGMANYLWDMTPGSGTITWVPGSNEVSIFWNSPGTKWVSVNYTNPGGCSAPSPTIYNVTVNSAPPAPVIIRSHDTLFSNATTGNQWYKVSTGLIPGATGQWYVVTANGTYYDKVSNALCTSEPSNMIEVLNTNIANYTYQDVIKVYPNPANEFIYIEQATAIRANIKILDASGKLVHSCIISDKKNRIDINNLPAGFYSLQYNSSNSSSVVKIIKMK